VQQGEHSLTNEYNFQIGDLLMASTYLQRTNSGAETDTKKATISAWVKLGNHVGNFNAGIFGTYASGNYGADGNSQIGFYNGGLYAWFKDSSTSYYKQESTRRFRDNNAWYHLVYRFDMTQSTASDRIRVYVNNEEITSWSSTNNPGSTQNIQMNNGGRIVRIGTYNFTDGTHNYLDGSMSHFHFCDGYSYAPTEFGEYDANGVWKIILEPNVTYGNNGFFILKDGNSVTDQSGNSNNFTVSYGTLTNTEDNPSNVFATLNPLGNYYPASTFSKGNLQIVTSSGNSTFNNSTIGVSTGKWYCEVKNASDNRNIVGIVDRDSISTTDKLDENLYGYGYYDAGQVYNNGSTLTAYSSYTTNDIIGIALDLTNNKVFFSKNGTWQGSSNPATNTGGISIAPVTSNRTGVYHFSFGDSGTSHSATHQTNFGNGYFGTTPVASAGTNASGIGIFEYDVPTGYTALSTKGLNL